MKHRRLARVSSREEQVAVSRYMYVLRKLGLCGQVICWGPAGGKFVVEVQT